MSLSTTGDLLFYLKVISSGALYCSKGVSVGPVPISIWQVSIVALLAGPAITHSAPSINAVLMDARHQRPSASSCGHVTVSLVQHAITCCQVVYSIWKCYSIKKT